MITNLYYFGCWNEVGHYFHDPNGRRPRVVGPFDAFDRNRPIDAIYAPFGVNQDESATNLAYTNGWTVLAMWDRSIDSRPGSNAAFLAEGKHTENEMLASAKQLYPQIVNRLKAAPKTEIPYINRDDPFGE